MKRDGRHRHHLKFETEACVSGVERGMKAAGYKPSRKYARAVCYEMRRKSHTPSGRRRLKR
jgi:hypothetical protein